MTHAVIIGNGVTGATAARHLRSLEPDWAITMISGESTYHYSRPALMYIFMGHMKYADTKPFPDQMWDDERIDLLRDWVTGIDTDSRTIQLHANKPITYDRLLIATGSKSNRFGWPGQDLNGVQGLYDLMDLHQLNKTMQRARRAVIVGGGLIGLEFAEMLHSRGVHVTFLVRESSYWNNVLPPEESAMVTKLIRDAGFDLRLGAELKEIVGDDSGAATHVITGDGERIDAEVIGLTAGVSPNLDLIRDTNIECGRGVLVDWSLRTNIGHVFAAGDCAELVTEGEARNVMQQVWYTGKKQGRVAAESMAGRDVTYDPGIWFNSAKFLDLEYQTYGFVPNRPQDDHVNLWWQDATGERGLRLVLTPDHVLLAMNTMGMRYRHEVCEAWIRDERSLAYVLDHLADANFDPEFYRQHEADITAALRTQADSGVTTR